MNKNYKLKIKNCHLGQIGIVVLIMSALIITIGMSLSKKTVVDTKIDTDTELAKSAFDTAESGIDYYVRTGTTEYIPPSDGGVARKANVLVSDLGINDEYIFESSTANGKSEYFWLVNHDENGDIGGTYFNDKFNVCVNVGFSGSVKVDYFYKVGSDYKVERVGFNFNLDDKIADFTDVTGTCSPDIDFTSLPDSILLVMTPLFSSATFTVTTSSPVNFLAQGKEITSTGKSGDLEGVPINRSVTMIDRYKIPAFLLEAITAEGDVSSE